MTRVITILLVALGLFLGYATCEPTFGTPNVCNKTVSVRKDHSVDEPVKYEVKFDAMCGIFPCTKTRVMTRMNSRILSTLEDMNVAVCCPGYAEAPDRQCLPICLRSCNSGKCVKPNVCECNPRPTESSPGFIGATCNMFSCLVADRWGAKCDRECNCPPNSYCSANTGKCLCSPGWRGSTCSEECESNSDCADVELPPIMEPEANVFNEILGSSQKLEMRPLEREIDEELSYGMSSATIAINLFLVALVCVLILSVFRYRSRLDKLRNELYYGPASSTGSTPNSSNYSASSLYSTATSVINPQNRPRMPIPTESDHFSKNLSFATATRNILNPRDNEKIRVERETIVVDQKLESHLIKSHKASQQNLYSECDSNLSERSYHSARQPNPISTPSDARLLNVCVIPEENAYQVPKSPALKTVIADEELQRQRQNLLDESNEHPEFYVNNDQIYEEIKPRSPSDAKK